ncbi:MAG: GNAT family N-acetyltransferase [Chloroflexia bacterium]
MTGQTLLRDVAQDDLPIFFEHQQDPGARHMVAFTSRDPNDREAFMAHWARILADDGITKRTILLDGQVAGNILSFVWDGKPEVGYWIGREYWGKGLATRALTHFLKIVTSRPLYAQAAKDNTGSIRVLEKCGFIITGYVKSFANARGEEIEEAILELK